MKSWPKVKLGQVQVGSNIAQNHSSSTYCHIGSHIWSLFAPGICISEVTEGRRVRCVKRWSRTPADPGSIPGAGDKNKRLISLLYMLNSTCSSATLGHLHLGGVLLVPSTLTLTEGGSKRTHWRRKALWQWQPSGNFVSDSNIPYYPSVSSVETLDPLRERNK